MITTSCLGLMQRMGIDHHNLGFREHHFPRYRKLLYTIHLRSQYMMSTLLMLTIVVGVTTVIYTFNLVLNLGMAARTVRNSQEEHIDDAIVHTLKNANWPMYTILCPLYREAQGVPQFVQAMQSLDYPPEKLQILFLTEANDA